MSTEDEILKDAKHLRVRLIKEANKPLDIRIVGAMGRLIELHEDARGQVTPDREAIQSALFDADWYSSDKWEDSGRLAAAILALFNEKGNE